MNILKHSESKTRNTAPLIDTHGYPYPNFYFILMHIYVAVKQKKLAGKEGCLALLLASFMKNRSGTDQCLIVLLQP